MTPAHSVFNLPDLIAHSQRLVRRAQQLPPAGARPVTIQGKVAGWVGPAALGALAQIAGMHPEPEALHIKATAQHNLSAVLHEAALALRAAGCTGAWRNEALDVFAEGQRFGQMERAAVRPLGLLTRAVHLNAWTQEGKLWVARRALNKSTDPGLWDTLSGGLVAAGEDLHSAMLRETHEEAGLAAVMLTNVKESRLVLRMHRRLPEGYQVENVYVADCVLAAGTVPNNLDGEVMEFRCLAPAELAAMLGTGAFTLEAELVVLDSLQHRLGLPAQKTAYFPATTPVRTGGELQP